nr:DUF397 domain-containing protein [Streptomyces palmae]
MERYQVVADEGGNNGQKCVEVATNVPGVVARRDSKDPAGPILRFAPEAWADFHVSARRGEFDPL